MDILVILLVAIMLVVYTGWVTSLVIRSAALERHQKIIQIALAWLIPALGAVVVHLVNREQEGGSARPKASGAEPQIDQGVSPRDFIPPNLD